MDIEQLITTRVAPIDFTVNAVVELRISKLRDSDEDFSLQVHYVIRQCSMQNRPTEQTLFLDLTRRLCKSANAVFNFCS